jgi:hypothetical protein
MKLALSLFGFMFFTSMVHADAVYTCANERGDTVIIKLTGDGQQMSLHSVYAGLKLIQSKQNPANPVSTDYLKFRGHYPTADGYSIAAVSVQASLVRGEAGPNEIVGSVKFEGDQFGCRVGEGKLTVSRATRREFSTGQRGEPCKLTTYYQGMTFIPPRVVCNYGNGIVSITGGGRPF